MASETSIINIALTKLGATRIQSRTDGTPNANTMNDVYDDILEDLLRHHHWNFATKKVQLARLVSTPEFGFQFKYQLPAGIQRVVSVHADNQGNSTPEYSIEEGVIHASSSEIYLEYIVTVDDPNLMTSDFRKAFSMELASQTALKITGSSKVMDSMEKSAISALRRAKGSDSIENFPDQLQEGSWVNSRGR